MKAFQKALIILHSELLTIMGKRQSLVKQFIIHHHQQTILFEDVKERRLL